MKNFIIAFLVFCLWAVLGMWYYSCVIKGICTDEYPVFKTQEVVEDIVIDPQIEAQRKADSLALIEEQKKQAILAEKARVSKLFSSRDFKAQLVETGDTIFFYPNPVTIYKNRRNVYIPQPNRSFSSRISNYFNSNRTAELVIFGAYDPTTERVNSDSLGLERARFIKERLVRSGLNADRINVKAVSRTLSFDSRGRNYEGIYLEFRALSKDRQTQVEQGISNKILYSGFARETFKPDITLQNYAKDLIAYLEKYPNKTVAVIGHTDNIGNDEDNKWVGLQRAKSVRRYLISQGVAATRISASSKGESSPIVTNTSNANRAKNRRIEIQVN